MSYSKTEEKLFLSFYLKNCVKDNIYKINILSEDASSKEKEQFETEERKCVEDNLIISFNKKMSCNYYFERIKNLNITITKNIPFNSTYKTNVNKRLTVLSSLITSSNSNYEREINKEDNSEILSIKVERENNNSTDINNSLFEYFKAGIKLSCFISMDFSDEKNIPSLSDTKNNYLTLINNINNSISTYTKNNLFYTSIFGAKNTSSEQTIPDLNQKESSGIPINMVFNSLEALIKKKQFLPENNIIFSSLIKKITTDINKLYEQILYNVAFIIVRGNIDKKDKKKTIDAIIQSSYLPLTIFIIGVGKNDFSLTKKIIGKKYNYSSNGMEKFRDNVFFISLKEDFSNNDEQLISWCLIELYKQIIDFYNLIKFSPKDLNKGNMENINKSFIDYNNANSGPDKFVIKKPKIYESVEGKNNEFNFNQENVKESSFGEIKSSKNEQKFEDNENKDEVIETNIDYSKKYNIPCGSTIDLNNLGKIDNPYQKDLYIKNNWVIVEEANESKNSQNVNNASEVNKNTKNNEVIKESNNFLFNNYSVKPL